MAGRTWTRYVLVNRKTGAVMSNTEATWSQIERGEVMRPNDKWTWATVC